MTRRFACFVFASLLFVPSVAAEDKDNPPGDFEAIFSIEVVKALEDEPALKKAYENWKDKAEEATTKYLAELDKFFAREKSRGDLDYLKSLESALDKAKSRPVGPCLTYDHLPAKAQRTHADLNKTKGEANKKLLTAVDKAIETALKQKDVDKARKLEEFLFAALLPKSLEAEFSKAIRYKNKVFLHVATRKTWEEASMWCLERNGDLPSIRDEAEQKALLKISRQGYTWIGAMKPDSNWRWSDGTPLRFTNWAKNEPSNASTEKFAAFPFDGIGHWYDQDIRKTHPFVIQWTLY